MGDSPSSRRLLLPAHLLREIEKAGEASYPHECCGLLVGNPSSRRVDRVVAADNLNTERARDRYELDPKAFLRVEKELRGSDDEVIGVYHSHPDHPARPSPTDLERAWPNWSYVIVAIHSGRAVACTSWMLPDFGQTFEQEAIELDDPVD